MELTSRKGVGLIALGMLMVAISLFLAVHYVMDEWRSGGYAASALTVMAQPGDTADSETGLPARMANGETYIGVLSIPALDLELPVMDTFTFSNRKMGPGLYWGSPGEDGMVIAGYCFRGHFAPLNALKPGDEVIYTGVGGEVHRYRTAELETLRPSQVKEMLSSDYPLTLFTSTPGGIARLAVRCSQN